MILQNNYSYLIIVLILTLSTIILLKKKIINHYPIKDKPSARKLHSKDVSLVGGLLLIAYFSIFIISYILIFNLQSFLNIFIFFSERDLIYFLIILSIFILVGIIDDKFSISASTKVVIYSLLIVILVVQNTLTQINYLDLQNISIPLGNSKIIFTSIFLLSLVIAMNLYDGINLQSSSFYLIIFSFLSYHLSSITIFLFFVPPLILFSIFNYKNEVFLGEAGVNILILFSSIIMIKTYNLNYLKLDLDFSLLVSFFLFPLLDATRLFLIRSLYFGQPFRPDNNHIHHKLLNKFKLVKTLIFLNLQNLVIISFYLTNFNSFFAILFSVMYYIFLLRLAKKSNV